MRRAALVALALFAASCGARTDPRPNVLLLVMDTTRADRCSFLGYARPTTPRLAEFAKDATVFREAWSPAGWTGPAHASLFTGLRPEHHGFDSGARDHLGGEHATLAEAFTKAGYATACFSNNDVVSPEFGLTRGFAEFQPLYRDERRPYPYATATHEKAAAWAESRRDEGKPFFLFVNDMEPHLPYTPPENVAKPLLRDAPTAEEIAAARAFDFPRPLWYSMRAEEIAPRKLALLSDLYDAEIATLDREIGALLDRLRADGLLENTIVVIAGDHGEHLGENHQFEHGYSLHRAVRHVPLLVRAPGKFDVGRVVSSVVRLEDVAPTLLELCALQTPADLDGVSLLHDLDGRVSRAEQGASRETKERLERAVPGADATPLATSIRAVFDGRFHFISSGDGREELYDVAADPDERENLATRDIADAAKLRALDVGTR